MDGVGGRGEEGESTNDTPKSSPYTQNLAQTSSSSSDESISSPLRRTRRDTFTTNEEAARQFNGLNIDSPSPSPSPVITSTTTTKKEEEDEQNVDQNV